jgi:hypothetical protein
MTWATSDHSARHVTTDTRRTKRTSVARGRGVGKLKPDPSNTAPRLNVHGDGFAQLCHPPPDRALVKA